jgi:aspartate/methionine/tyrosine aminotransferase
MTPFIVMDIVAKAAKIKDAIHFEVGQPDLSPSPKVKEALKRAVDANQFAYTPSNGLLELRQKIAQHYLKSYNVSVSPEQIFLTPGSSGAFLIAYSLTLGVNDKLGLSDPSYPCYKNFAHILNIDPVFMNVYKESNYQLQVSDLQKVSIDALQISSPANPTGNIYTKENLASLIEYCEREEIAFISDELYHGLHYDEPAHTALEFSKKSFVINGFSKYFCMPGLRLGWIIVPKEYIAQAEIVAQNLFICAPTLSQYAALEAFEGDYLKHINKTFKERRDYLYKELSTLFKIDAKPQGAFYLWADVSKYTNNSFEFAKELLEKIGVATTPGIDFGANQTNKYLRFAYTRDIEHMAEGVKRLKNYLLG